MWRAVLAKRLKASDEALGELTMAPGAHFYVAFAVWEGAVSFFIIICSTHAHWFLRSLNAMRYAESHEISKYERR
jgi:hypothetical protein